MAVQIGVIGAGMIGADHVRRLGTVGGGARVTAVTDIDAGRAATVAADAGARPVPTAADVIAAGDVDAVLVTSPGFAHTEPVLAAIAAGKPVFCEKPLATTAADCLRVVDAETRRGARLVQVGFMRRYDSGYRAMKRVIDSGEIGAPLLVHCAHRNPTVPESYHSEMATHDTAIHEIDTVRWLLGDEIVSARVLTPRRTTRRFPHLRDPQIMLWETAAGVRVDVEVFVNCQYGYDIRCEAVGEEGVVRLPDPAAPEVRRAGQRRGEVLQHWRDRFAAAYETEIQAWVDSVAAGETGGPSAWDGYAAAMIGDATVEALHSGGDVATRVSDRPALYA